MSKTKTFIAPADCNEQEICCITRDNFSVGDFSILTDTFTVSLSEQKLGEHATQSISIPVKTFNKLAEWYFTSQRVIRNPKDF